MIVTLKWAYADGSFGTKTLKLVCGSIDLGKTQVDDANKLCQEIVRRFNEFPEEGKL